MKVSLVIVNQNNLGKLTIESDSLVWNAITKQCKLLSTTVYGSSVGS